MERCVHEVECIFYIYKSPLSNYVFSLFDGEEDFFKRLEWDLLYEPEE